MPRLLGPGNHFEYIAPASLEQGAVRATDAVHGTSGGAFGVGLRGDPVHRVGTLVGGSPRCAGRVPRGRCSWAWRQRPDGCGRGRGVRERLDMAVRIGAAAGGSADLAAGRPGPSRNGDRRHGPVPRVRQAGRRSRSQRGGLSDDWRAPVERQLRDLGRSDHSRRLFQLARGRGTGRRWLRRYLELGGLGRLGQNN